MPIVEKRSLPGGGVLGVWHICEPDTYFESRMKPNGEEDGHLGLLKGKRRTEWLASRWLLHILSEREVRGPVTKDEFGKPHLRDSDWHISLSHTREYAAVIAAPFLVGIDIQIRVDKIVRIGPKFLSADEFANVRKHEVIPCMHVYWGAKESLYKAYGRRALDFREDIQIADFDMTNDKTTGKIARAELSFDIYFDVSEAFILVYALNNKLEG